MNAGEPSPGPENADRDRVVVVGPGRVGQSLALALADRGRPVTVIGRRPEPPDALADRPGVRYRRGVPAGPRAPDAADGPGASHRRHGSETREAGDASGETDDAFGASHARGGSGSGEADGASGASAVVSSTLVFCVPDDGLPAVARSWARELPPVGQGDAGGAGGGEPEASPPVALHTSGVHPGDVLAPLRDAGWAVAAWHPLTALAAPRPDAFRGVTFGVEGDDTAADRARGLARQLGGRAIEVEAGAQAGYHAAAVFASNFLVACLATAARELADATGGEGGMPDLLPLARAALDNLSEDDVAAGATGPLTRGDVGTVRRHLEALSGEAADLYRRLARELLTVVEGRLTPPTAEELRRVLDTDA